MKIYIPGIHDVYKADMHVHWRTLADHYVMQKTMAEMGIDPAISAPGFLKQRWDGMPAFHREYETVFAKLMRSPEDIHQAAKNYFEQGHRDRMIYSEISISLRHDKEGKPTRESFLDALVCAADEARRDYGIETRFIANTVRDFGGEYALNVAKRAVALRDRGYPIVAYGMSGDESCNVAIEEYLPAYEYVSGAGLYGTAHTGEVSAHNFYETIRVLGRHIQRGGHGIHALQDRRLLDWAVLNYWKNHKDDDRRIVLEILLSANGQMSDKFSGSENHPVPTLAKHPAPDLWKAGMIIVLGTDNPGPLKTSIGREYQIAHDMGFTLTDLTRITTAAMKHSFADTETKARLHRIAHTQKKAFERMFEPQPAPRVIELS